LADLNAQLIKIEKERRRRLSEAADAELGAEVEGMSAGEKAKTYATNLVNEANRGVMEFLPSGMREKMEGVGIGVETDFSNTPQGRGVRFASQGTTMALPLVRMGNVGPQLYRNAGMVRSFVDDLAKTATSMPKTFFGAEAVGSYAAGNLGQRSKDSGSGELGQLGAEMAGGLTMGGIASMGPRSLRMLREGFQANMLPFTERGGMIRAGRQMQERAGGPEAAANLAQSLDSIPEGVSPAQWIGNERLMAQEARLLTDNPQLENFVKGELQEARLIAQEELQDSFGKARTRQDWEVSVLNRVTPDDFEVTAGMTDEMLDEAYASFKPLYDGANGHLVNTGGISAELIASPNSPEIMAIGPERETVSNWIKTRLTAYDLDAAQVDSEVLLDLRSKVRSERRLQSKRGRDERADLLGAAEAVLTKRINDGIPPGAQEILQQADSQYRRYKVVENAIFDAADSNLTPADLSRSIQQGGLTTDSRYARGVDADTQELRQAALAGRSTEELLGDPQRAQMVVRNLSDEEKALIHADFTETLYRRATSAEATDSGVALLSGEKLLRDVVENRDVMKNLGMEDADINRLQYMGEKMLAMSKKTPQAVANLFEDGPANLLQLAAALAGAKSGQKIAGQGMGSSLVLAQYMSNKARNNLARITSDEAGRLMRDAATDPELYRTLLTTSTVGRDVAKNRARYLEGWLLSSAFDTAKDLNNGN
jgi:hypothetical protein